NVGTGRIREGRRETHLAWSHGGSCDVLVLRARARPPVSRVDVPRQESLLPSDRLLPRSSLPRRLWLARRGIAIGAAVERGVTFWSVHQRGARGRGAGAVPEGRHYWRRWLGAPCAR